jgi:hypothetical protein
MPRASLVEKRARALCVELTRVTANTPMEYWMVRLIARLVATDYETADAAIAHAVVERGWLVGEGDARECQFSCVRAFHGRLSSTECSRQTLGKEDGELRVGGSPLDGRLPMNAKIPQRQVEQFGGGFV